MPTILCIDDSEPLKTRRMVLEKNGYRVLAAIGPQDALEVLKSKTVDCVIARHRPPAIDGVRVAKVIREFFPALPLILLSTNVTGSARKLVDEQVSNLDGPEALLRSIRRVLEDRQPLQKNLQQSRARLQSALHQSMRLRDQASKLEEKFRRQFREGRDSK